MEKCAVIIGVDKTGGLPKLNAAGKGANDFNNWALSQGFVTRLHTDATGPVTINDIHNSVSEFVNQRRYSLMIIFFAGHGILKSATDERWLLSNSPANPNEAVSVLPSKMLARKTGIDHVVFISDACRSIPNDPLINEVSGSIIFPNIASTLKKTDIDMFYATRPGDPSYEVKEDLATKNYSSIYTKYLLKGLGGTVPEILSDLKEGDDEILAILANDLELYLESVVPLAAEKINITLIQNPDAEVTSRTPKYLAKFRPGSFKETESTPVKANEISNQYKKKYRGSGFIDYDVRDRFSEYFGLEGNEMTDSVKASVAKLVNAKGRESFETKTGFTIIGGSETYVETINGKVDIFREGNVIHIRVYESKKSAPATILLLFPQTNSAVPLAVLPGFIGTVVLENNKVININYSPSRNSNRMGYTAGESEQIEKSRAYIATAARYGLFKLEGEKDFITNMASYIRMNKAFDPTLGLYAAYAYAQAGDYKGIKSIYGYMKKEPEPVLFDVSMLNQIMNNFKIDSLIKVAPFCPLLTQGWSYLSTDYEQFQPILKDLSKYLIPGLWTTFNDKGVDLIRQAFQDKLIL